MNLKQSTAYNRVILMIDSTDHITGKTGLTLTITASKDGVAFASISPTVTELVSGWYKIALTSSHTDTLGDFAMHITGTGADPTDTLDQVTIRNLSDLLIATDIRSAVGLASANLDTQIDTLPTFAELTTALGTADDATLSAIAALSIPTANQNAAAILDLANAIETGVTLRQALRLQLSAMVGKLSGAATTNILIRDTADSKNRINATVDADGNRTAVILDGS